MSVVAFDTLKLARPLRETAKRPAEPRLEAPEADVIGPTLGAAGSRALASLGAAFAASRTLRP